MTFAGRAMGPKDYAEHWGIEGAGFVKRGDYAWMAEMLGPCETFLEVGTGPGYSTEALVKSGKRVIGIEQNEFILNQAEERLRSHGTRIARAGQADFSSEAG